MATTSLAAATLLAAGGCSGDRNASGGGRPVDEVTYITGLGLSGQHAGGVFTAIEKGWFADEHIAVKVQPGRAGDYNLTMLRQGKADFVAVDYAGAVLRAGTGRFGDVRCVAVLQKKTTNALMVLESSGIRGARDLVGKTVGVVAGSAPKRLFPAYAKLSGLSDDQIKQVRWQEALGPQLPTVLAAGRVDAIGQFVPARSTVSKVAKGAPVRVLAYGDVMTDLYGAVLVARADVDKDLARRFVRALARGDQYAVDHPDEAGQIVHKHADATSAEGAAAELKELSGYTGSPAADPEVVARSFALLQGIGQIPTANIDPDDVFDFAVADGVEVR